MAPLLQRQKRVSFAFLEPLHLGCPHRKTSIWVHGADMSILRDSQYHILCAARPRSLIRCMSKPIFSMLQIGDRERLATRPVSEKRFSQFARSRLYRKYLEFLHYPSPVTPLDQRAATYSCFPIAQVLVNKHRAHQTRSMSHVDLSKLSMFGFIRLSGHVKSQELKLEHASFADSLWVMPQAAGAAQKDRRTP